MSQPLDSYLGLCHYRSAVRSENTTGNGLPKDEFEIFDPRGLFSPRRRLSADNAKFNHDQLSSSSSSQIQPIPQSHSVSPLPSSSPVSPPSSRHSHIYQHQNQSRSPGHPSKRHSSDLSGSPFLPSFILPSEQLSCCNPGDVSDHGFIQIDSHPGPNDPRFESAPLDDPVLPIPATSDLRPFSPFDSPLSPCSSLQFCRSPPLSLKGERFANPSSPSSVPRGRSSLPRHLTGARAVLAPSSTLPARRGASPGSSSSPHASYRIFAHENQHHRPAPIVTTGISCESSLPSRGFSMQSPNLSASISSLAYLDMDASPAVNFLASFANSTLPPDLPSLSPVQADTLSKGDLVAGHSLGPIIGRGGFSIVREALHLDTGAKVAVKIIRRPVSQAAVTATLPRASSLKSRGRGPRQPILAHSGSHPPQCSQDRSSSTPLSSNTHLVKSAHLPLPTSVTENLSMALLKREIRIWSGLQDHPNVVPLLSLHETPTHTLIFMPICKSGNLLQLLNRFKNDPVHKEKCLSQVLNQAPSTPLAYRKSSELCRRGGLRLDLLHAIFRQIVEGLKYLHLTARIVHKDIKLENILIHHGQVKISGFGLAVYSLLERHPLEHLTKNGASLTGLTRDLSLPKHISSLPWIIEGNVMNDPLAASWGGRDQAGSSRLVLSDEKSQSSLPFEESTCGADVSDEESGTSDKEFIPAAAGSLAYTAPEQLRTEVPLARPALNMWALGCVLYSLVEGQLPFEDSFEPRLRLKIMNGEYAFPKSLAINPDLMSEVEAEERMMVAKVLKGCLAVDRNARWTIEEVSSSQWLSPHLPLASSPISDEGDSDFSSLLGSVNQNSNRKTEDGASGRWESFSALECSRSRPKSRGRLHQEDSDMRGKNFDSMGLITPVTTTPPLTRTELLDLRDILTSISPQSCGVRLDALPERDGFPHLGNGSPKSAGFERHARSKVRDGSDRHRLHATNAAKRKKSYGSVVNPSSPSPSRGSSSAR